MTDLISRADAIEAVASITMSIHLSNVICDKLSALPSAELPKGDLISRADAIEEFRECVKRANENGETPTWNDAVSLIGSLPSADAVHKPDYSYEADMVRRLKTVTSAEAGWIPCSERLPKEDECVGNVLKYYLIQDEYGDMHVAHLSSRGWETIESVKALGCDVVAWMPLPKPYKGGGDK